MLGIATGIQVDIGLLHAKLLRSTLEPQCPRSSSGDPHRGPPSSTTSKRSPLRLIPSSGAWSRKEVCPCAVCRNPQSSLLNSPTASLTECEVAQPLLRRLLPVPGRTRPGFRGTPRAEAGPGWTKADFVDRETDTPGSLSLAHRRGRAQHWNYPGLLDSAATLELSWTPGLRS